MSESDSGWRWIAMVILALAATFVVAAVLLWAVFYNDLTGFASGQRESSAPIPGGPGSGRIVASPTAKPTSYALPGGARVEIMQPQT